MKLRPHPPVKRRAAGWALALGVWLAQIVGGCGSAPPLPPKQVLEYERQTSVGLEKYRHGYVAQARVAFARALTHAELDDSHQRIASALINQGGMDLLLDVPEAAAKAYARAVREARTGALLTLEWQAQSGLAEATRRLGQAAKALELYAHRPDLGKSGDAVLALHADIGRALALADAGQPEEAFQLLQKTEAAAQARPQKEGLWASVRHAQARVLLARGRHEDALVAVESALHADRLLHHPPSVGEDHRLLAEILGAMQRAPEAQDHLERAAAIFSQTGQLERLRSLRSKKQ